jgi:hypothetical protein
MDDDKVTTIISADYMYLVFLGSNEIMSKIVDKLNSTDNVNLTDNVNSISNVNSIGNTNVTSSFLHKTNLNSSSGIVGDASDKKKSNKYRHDMKNRQQCTYIKTEIDSPCIDILEGANIQKILTDDAIKLTKKKKDQTKDQIKDQIKDQMKNQMKNQNDNNNVTSEDIDINKKYVVMDEGVETAQCLTYADMSYGLKRESPDVTTMLMVVMHNDSHYKLSYPILQLDEEENPSELIENWLKEHDLKGLIKELTINPVNIVGDEHDILVFSAVIS